MYCPKCGDALKRRADGALWCERGEMGLSQHLERGLIESFVDRTRIPRSTPLPFAVGDSWSCPGCGLAMAEAEPGLVVCSKCGLSLGEFIRELIEFHPHRRASAWRSKTECVVSTRNAAFRECGNLLQRRRPGPNTRRPRTPHTNPIRQRHAATGPSKYKVGCRVRAPNPGATMPRQVVKWILVVAAIAGAVLSAYGWWFHFTVGPTHGAGAEMGIVAVG